MTQKRMKKISVIIVTYNSEKDIYDCVTSIRRCADIDLSEIELIVVDNQSRGCQQMFSKLKDLWGEDIILVENTHNGGYGQGNNIGIAHSTAPIVMIMNPDVRLVDKCFRTVVDEFDSDSRLIMYGMKQMYDDSHPSTNSFCCTTLMNGCLRTLLTGLCVRLDWYIPRIMYFSGSCFFVRKDMFESVGLFDESVFLYGEEDDIHYRLMKRYGTKFKYNPHLRYIHLVQGRKLSVDYETKLLEVDLYHHEKKGFGRLSTLRTYLQINTTLLVRSHVSRLLGRCDEDDFRKLKEFRRVIKGKIAGEKNKRDM